MLSKKSKYAIKALVTLAKHSKDGVPMRIVEISEQEKIPKKFLEAILLDLRKHGILGSKMGINGGYYLLKKNGRHLFNRDHSLNRWLDSHDLLCQPELL